MFLIFDTETTGLPRVKEAPLTDFDNWPRLVQLAWQVHDDMGRLIEYQNHIVRPDGFTIPINATQVHGIKTEHALNVGKPLTEVLDLFLSSASQARYLIGHNITFDLNVVGCEFLRVRNENPLTRWISVDTCSEITASFCKIPRSGGRFKLPSLAEIHQILFEEGFDSAHNASADVEATARVFFELLRLDVFNANVLKETDDFYQRYRQANPARVEPAGIVIDPNMIPEDAVDDIVTSDYIPSHFTHLHVHSHYSILDGMSKVPDLVNKCVQNGMYSIALTDHGNMFGIKEFFDVTKDYNGKIKKEIKEKKNIIEQVDATEEQKAEARERIAELEQKIFKPIIGIEAYCAPISISKRDGRADRGWHLILLAKNKKGYNNLCKLSSIAYTDGFYYNPRIDHSLLERYHEGLIVCSACLGGELPQKIMNGDIEGAENSLRWFKNLFGDDYYVELQRHKTDKPNADREIYERQREVNKVLVDLARKNNVKIIATNDVHFVEEKHGEAHDRLICLSTGKDLDDPNRMHYTKQEWLKTPAEMGAIFSDLPEALENTREISDKVENYSIDSGPIMPVFPIPEEFGTEEQYRQKYTEEELFQEFTRDENGNEVMSREKGEEKVKNLGGYDKLYRIKLEADYLAELAWKGAHYRYGETLTEEQIERIRFELHIMKTMGFPGYFLIVQDYIRGAREELGVSVGPGRGSAAGSVVAYCLRITDVDPLKYDLLFERFLNPDRISLPDIDVDFDDDGRGRVLDWVTEKYGKEKVAHIITYGAMASKSAIADVGRVQKVPLSKVNEIKSFIPDKFPDNLKDARGKALKVNLKNCYQHVPELNQMLNGDDDNVASMLNYAQELEDTNRQIGIHACGVIIGATDLTDYAPMCTIRDKESGEDVVVTQYDGHVVESVGLIKMDFLGLKTLTVIKNAIANIKHSKGIDVDIDHIPIDDPDTYELFSAGNTIGTFQFESPGMQKHLRELKPTAFEDLIAMNALYRPGPMQYIPDFIDRKHGRKQISYDIPEMEKYLKDTYGITVYQEQVMLLSRLLANFTRGESDTLRKAMGKKLIDKMQELKGKFLKQGQENGHQEAVLNKIWADWEQFASYAFNKSHATCYSWIAYQTAYLKAHYPSEYMAAVLNNSIGDIKVVTFMMDECKRMKIPVLVPDINESRYEFAVNDKGEIRFGMGAIKNVGEAAVEGIVTEREKNGRFKSFSDFLLRTSSFGINKRALETMATAGCFDSFPQIHRATLFYVAPNETATFLEKAIRMVNAYNDRKNSAQIDLFGFGTDDGAEEELVIPIPECERWNFKKELQMEMESIGLFLSSHPMDAYRVVTQYFANVTIERILAMLDNENNKNMQVRFSARISSVDHIVAQNGSGYAKVRVEDKSGVIQFGLYRESYLKFKHLCQEDVYVLVSGTLREKWNKKAQTEEQKSFSGLELSVSEIRYLDSILEETNKLLEITVMVNEIDEERLRQMIDILINNPGKQKYSIVCYDSQMNMNCNLSPLDSPKRKAGINIANVIKAFENMNFETFRLK